MKNIETPVNSNGLAVSEGKDHTGDLALDKFGLYCYQNKEML